MKILNRIIIILIMCVVMIACKTSNPYKVLGVSRDATDDQIKKAFNKRSRKYHPDRNKQDPRAKEKFEKVVNAYELLKDPQRRRMYDMTGSDDPQQGMGGGGFGGGGFGINMDDLFNMGFGGMGGGFEGGFGGGGGNHGRGRRRSGGQRTYTFSFGGGGGGGNQGGFRFDL